MTDVVVLGQIGRALVLTMGALPPPGGSAAAGERLELLGPLLGGPAVDPTGGGDSSVAALAAAPLRGAAPQEAARAAAVAASLTVAHPGGRPALTPAVLREVLHRDGPHVS